MPKFKLEMNMLESKSDGLFERRMLKAIKDAGNKTYKTYFSPRLMRIVVECDYKPADMPEYGVMFVEMTDEK